MQSAPKVLRFLASRIGHAMRAGGVSAEAALREAQILADHPPVGRMVEIDGVGVHVLVQGSGPDLVLIHGAGGNLRDFTYDLVPRLTDRYRVIAFDRPGHGNSGVMDVTSPTAQATLLRKAGLEVGLTKPIILGQSYGAAVALAWALNQPEDTRALVLVAGATMPWPGRIKAGYHINGSRIGAATVVPMITAFATREQAMDVLERVFEPQPVPPGYAEHLAVGLSMRREALVQNSRQITGLRPEVVRMSEHYGTLNLPVELIHGDADTIVPLSVHSRPLSALLPDANLTVLPGIGHMPQHAAVTEVVAAIDRVARRAGLRCALDTANS